MLKEMCCWACIPLHQGHMLMNKNHVKPCTEAICPNPGAVYFGKSTLKLCIKSGPDMILLKLGINDGMLKGFQVMFWRLSHCMYSPAFGSKDEKMHKMTAWSDFIDTLHKWSNENLLSIDITVCCPSWAIKAHLGLLFYVHLSRHL